jgi:hypothetical protein
MAWRACFQPMKTRKNPFRIEGVHSNKMQNERLSMWVGPRPRKCRRRV